MISKEFTITDSPEVEVRVGSGRVEITEGPVGKVTVEVDTRDEDFVVEQRGSLVFVSSDRNKNWLSRSSDFVTISMPPGGEARVTTASARVDIEPHLARLDVKTASGDIEASSGEIVTIKTASGQVELDSVTRALRVATASGDVFVREQSEGTVGINSASGDIHIERCEAAIDVSTMSGDVFLNRFAGSQASLKSMSGNIGLGIPSGTKVDLDANILSGRLRTPEPRESPVPLERHMTVKAKLVSGDLTIDRV